MLETRKIAGNSKKFKKRVQNEKHLEEGELDDESFCKSIDCEDYKSPCLSKTEKVLTGKEFGKNSLKGNKEERRAKKRRRHRGQKRKHKSSRMKSKNSIPNRPKSASVNEDNDSPPLLKKKRNEAVKPKKQMTFREFEPGICRFSESPEITESDMSLCESVSNAIASSHNLLKSSELSMSPFRTSTPFFGHENRRKTSSSGSDSCYSELEMHLKKRHDCLSHNEASGSAASSKCVYVDDDLCHPMHEPHHPTHRRSAPPKEPFFRSEREDFHPMDYVEDRFRRFHDFPEQGRRDFYHPHFQEFHRFDDFVDHRHPKDCFCRHPPPDFFPPRPRIFVSRDCDEQRRYDLMRIRSCIDSTRNEKNKPAHEAKPKENAEAIQAEETLQESDKQPSPLSRSATFPPASLPPHRETPDTPINTFKQTLKQHIEDEKWVEASRLLLSKLAADRNPREEMPAPFNMPPPPTLPNVGNGLLHVPDTQMFRLPPIRNFSILPLMAPPGSRPPPMVPLPLRQGPPMSHIMSPAVRPLPPPQWLPQQMAMKQQGGPNILIPPPLPIPPAVLPSAQIAPATSPKFNNNKGKKNDYTDTTKMGVSQEATTDENDNCDNEKSEDVISLDDPDVISVSSDSRKADTGTSLETSVAPLNLHRYCTGLPGASKNSSCNPSKSTAVSGGDDEWSYSSDEGLVINEKASSASSSVQSIIDIISKKKNEDITLVDSNLLSKVADVIDLSPAKSRESATYVNRTAFPNCLPVVTSSTSSSMTLFVPALKTTPSTEQSFKLALKTKKCVGDSCGLRKEPVDIPLEEVSNHPEVANFDPRKNHSASKKEFSATIPEFHFKNIAKLSGKITTISQNCPSTSQQAGSANVNKLTDPRRFRPEKAKKKGSSETVEKKCQITTPVALLTKPSISLPASLPELNADLLNFSGNSSKISTPELMSQEMPKFPSLMKENVDGNSNSVNENKLLSSISEICSSESRTAEVFSLSGKNYAKIQGVSDANIGHLPKLTPKD